MAVNIYQVVLVDGREGIGATSSQRIEELTSDAITHFLPKARTPGCSGGPLASNMPVERPQHLFWTELLVYFGYCFIRFTFNLFLM